MTMLNRRQFCAAAITLAVVPTPSLAEPEPRLVELWDCVTRDYQLWLVNGDNPVYLGRANR